MRTIDQSNYEEWIFEYYEGTLSAEEKAQVLDFVQMDSSYIEEFEAFSKTYLREPLPDKLSIESSLLRRENYFNLNYIIASTLVIIVSGLFLIKKTDDKSEVAKFSKGSVSNDIHLRNDLILEKRSSFQKHVILPRISTIESLEQLEIQGKVSELDSVYTSIANEISNFNKLTINDSLNNSDSLPSEQADIIKSEKVSDGNTKTTAQKSRQEKKEERKKLKQIAKFKEKQRRNKEAQKLMNGNMPYVVPLDPNTF